MNYTEKALEKALNNRNWQIRREAYRALGYTEKAFDDEHCNIRQEAYCILGYTEKALSDEDSDIREEAEIYFQQKKLREGKCE